MLTPEARLKLSTFVLELLQNDTRNAIEQGDVRSAMDDASRTVQSVISQFAVDWNSRTRTRRPIDLLPAELLIKCFGWLELRDRVSISCVSRDWRSSSLEHSALWATAVIRTLPQLEFVLERSQSAILRLRFVEFDFWFALSAYLRPHLPRLVTLQVHGDTGRLDTFTVWPSMTGMAMPSIRELGWAPVHLDPPLDPEWAEIVPKLEILEIEHLRFDETLGAAPFKNVTTLTTTLSPDSGIQSLWHVFPNIQRITFKLANTQILADAGEPPASLHTVSLETLFQPTSTTGYDIILDKWPNARLQAAMFAGPSDVQHSLMQYFIQSHNRPWNLRWGVWNWNIKPLFSNAARSHTVEFWIPAENVSHVPLLVVTLDHRRDFKQKLIRAICRNWIRLSSLEVQDTLLAWFIGANIRLPEVTRLTLIATGRATRSYRQDLHRLKKAVVARKASGKDAKMPTLRLPALEDVELSCMGWPGSTPWPSWYLDHVRAFLCKQFPVALEHYVRKSEPMLKRVKLRLIRQVLDAAVKQHWDLKSRLDIVAAEVHIECDVMGSEAEATEILDEDTLFLPSLYM